VLPHASRHLYCAGAAFSSFEKICYRIFSNPDFIGTEEKEAPYAVVGRI
jgi:hypothetical protein